MTPKIWNSVAKKIEPNSNVLAKIGLAVLISYAAFLGIAFWNGYKLNQLVVLPILFLFFLGGLGLVQYGFKTFVEKESQTIDEYMTKATTSKKITMWYSSIFISVFLIGVIYMASLIVLSIL